MGSDNIPLESRVLYSGISWDKGCYIGQEVIARMHYVGKPNRHLRRVSLDSGRQPEPGELLYDDTERMIGWMGSSIFHAPSQAWMGLAVMKRKYAIAGQVIRDARGPLGTVMDERDIPSE